MRLIRGLHAHPVGRAAPYAGAAIVSAAASVLLVLLLTRTLSAAGYGLYAAVTGVVLIAQSGGYLAWQTSVIRFHPRAQDAEALARLATATRLAFVVTTLAIAAVWAVILHWLGAAGITAPLASAGFVLLAARGWVGLVQAWNRAEDRLWRFLMLEALQSIGGLALVVVALRFHPGEPATAIWASALAVLAAAAWAPALALQPVRTRGAASLMRELLGYGAPLMLVQLAGAALAVSDRLIVAVHAGPAVAGAYAVAFAIADRLLNLVLLPVPLAINPRLFAAWEKDRPAAPALIETIGGWLMLGGLPLVTLLVLRPAPIARLIAGPTLAPAATPFIPWLAIGSFLAVLLTLYFALAFQLTRTTRWMIVVVGAPAVLNVAANMVAVPRYGAQAAAITTVAAYAIGLALALLIGRRHMALPLPVRPFAAAVAISASLAAGLALLT